jgi:5'-deoxynucleotidase YfbR-like HD superfamily hydrolase
MSPITVPTLTGLVDIANPDPATITIKAMAHSLAKIDRWAGALEKPFSVAQHSLLVLEIFKLHYPRLAVEGGIHAVLHDGHEYIFGDWIMPAVKLIERMHPGTSRHIDNAKHTLDAAIRHRFGLQAPSMEIRAAIHEADQIAAATEWRSLMPATNAPNQIRAKPARITLKPLPWPAAAELFEQTVSRELAMLEHVRSAAE